MRNDLTKACVSCAWRIASDGNECPRCGMLLVPPRVALDALGDPKVLSTKVGRPIRDAVVYGSSAILSVASVLGGTVLGLSTVLIDGFTGSGGMQTTLLFLSVFAFIAAFAIVFGVAWAVFAGGVFALSWLAGRNRPASLRVASFAHLAGAGHEPPAQKWLDAANRWFDPRKKRVIVTALVVIASCELAAELLSSNSIFFHRSIRDVLATIALAAVCQLVAFAFLSVPTLLAIQWALWSLDHLRRVRHLLRERARDHLAGDIEAHHAELTSERGHGEGRLVQGDAKPLIAPLSGEACLGFRLVGRVGSVLLDDAVLASEVQLYSDEGGVVLRAEHAIVVLPEASERTRELTPEQRERVLSLLQKLGLPTSDDVELGESLLREGNRVNAHGAESSEAAPSNDYRSSAQRRLLTDADGVPLLLLK